ncbi:MAG: hypothetical protein ACRD68_11295, partial [Pyrinomonadaceae bacterium]
VYGVGLANMILFPVASRLRERHESFMRRREALADALVALAANELPSVIAQRFAAHESPGIAASETRQRKAAR